MKTKSSPESPVVVDWDEVDRVLVAFERAHRESDDAVLGDFVPESDDPNYLVIAQELLRVDLEFSWSGGSPKELDDYRSEFPRLFAHDETLSAIAYEEFRLRKQAGQDVKPQEYADRYGICIDEWDGKPDSHETSVTVPVLVHRLLGSVELPTDATIDTIFDWDDFPQLGDRFLSFRLVRELGRGAFARVYYAEQQDMANRPVALKLSTQHRHESQTLARLQHTNIVPIYSTHSAGRFTAICMPYFGAKTLDDVLRRIRENHSLPQSSEGILSTVTEAKNPSTVTMPATETVSPAAPPNSTPLQQMRSFSHVEAVLWIAAELAEGLAFAHDVGVIHRDLKPANVLIADDGRPMLLDFNLATAQAGQRTVVGGTPSHMAPEQLAELMGENVTVDHRSDLYSLGLIVHELLTGRLPTNIPQGEFRERLVALRTLRERIVPPASAHNPAITPAIDSILAKCLAPKPEDRYQNAKNLGEDLRCQLSNLPLRHARETSLRERQRKFVLRNPWLRSLPFLAVVLLLTGSAAAYGLMSAVQHRERAEMIVRYQGFVPRASAARMRLSIPDLDRKRLEADVQSVTRLVERHAIQDSLLDGETRDRFRNQLSDLFSLLAHAEADLGMRETENSAHLMSALNWNRRAADIAHDERRKWSVDQQRVTLLKRTNRHDEAKLLKESLGSREDASAVLLDFADAFHHGEFQEAIAILAKQDPARVGVAGWFGRGLAHAELGEHAHAVAAFTTALALQPADNYRLHVHRGLASTELKDYSTAERDFSIAIEQRPDDARHFVIRAIARFHLKNREGALSDLDKALELDPDHTRSHFIRRQVLLQAGDKDAAEKALQEGLKHIPGDEVSWITRGVHKLSRKDAKGAIADFEEALKLNPKSRAALQNKSNALSEQLGNIPDAIRVLDDLVKYHPDSHPARAGRGVLHARQGDRAAAHKDAEEVLRRDPSPMMRYQVAGIYALTSRTLPEDVKPAMRLLAQAFKAGISPTLVNGDRDLDAIREKPDFVRLLGAVRTINSVSAN